MDAKYLPGYLRFYSPYSETAEQIAVVMALYFLKWKNNREPFCRLIKEGFVELLNNDRAKAILAAPFTEKTKVSSKKQTKRGRPFRSRAQEDEFRQLGYHAWYYHGLGYPKYNNPDIARIKSACQIVAENSYVSLSKVKQAMKAHESAFYKQFAEQDKRNDISRHLSTKRSLALKAKIKNHFIQAELRYFDELMLLIAQYRKDI